MLFERRHTSTAPIDQEAYGRSPNYQGKSAANQEVTPEIALSVSAVLASFTIVMEDISSLPMILYERSGREKNRAYQNNYYQLMHDQPNPEHGSMIFRELMLGHLLAWGNFYGQLIVNSAGDVIQIWPLRPDRMIVQRIKGERIYLYYSTTGKQRVFYPDEILHVPAFGFDGLIGYSRISLARNAIGLSMAAEKYGSKFFANDARPGIYLKHPGVLGDKAYERIKNDWNSEHQGVDLSHQTAILEEGMDIGTIGIPPEDAQFLETRKFQVSEIARIFRVPPHLIGDVEKSTSWGSGIDSQEQGYISHTLRPWMVRIEQTLNTQLLLPSERKTLFYEHLIDGLLRGDLIARYGAYVQAINNGIMNANEARERENMNPYDGGDVYRYQLNLGIVGTTQPASTNQGALEPLFRDTITRVVRREMNDLRGAVRRFLSRGATESFSAWAAQFYGQEHPEFIQKQFAPLLEAQQRLYQHDDGPQLSAAFDFYFKERLESLTGKTAMELESEIDQWLEQVPNELFIALECA
jgi:HK97 family phage portal protein